MRRSRLLLVAASCALIAACTYKPGFINEYKIDVQQGNVLTQEMVAQLKPGQTRDQVRFLLGTPWWPIFSISSAGTMSIATRMDRPAKSILAS
jgi:outer membrane protein assembly factor BamE (lipoprotein component of BamABCDE complex)